MRVIFSARPGVAPVTAIFPQFTRSRRVGLRTASREVAATSSTVRARTLAAVEAT